jgi:hypothetical protein
MRRKGQKNRTRIGPHLRQPRSAESRAISVAKIGYVRRSEVTAAYRFSDKSVHTCTGTPPKAIGMHKSALCNSIRVGASRRACVHAASLPGADPPPQLPLLVERDSNSFQAMLPPLLRGHPHSRPRPKLASSLPAFPPRRQACRLGRLPSRPFHGGAAGGRGRWRERPPTLIHTSQCAAPS